MPLIINNPTTFVDPRFEDTESVRGLRGTYVSLDGRKSLTLTPLIESDDRSTGTHVSRGLGAPLVGRFHAIGPNPAIGSAIGLTQGFAPDAPVEKVFFLLGVQRNGFLPGVSAVKLGDGEQNVAHELYRLF